MRQLEHHEIQNHPHGLPLALLCPDWRDPRNVGAAFRLADAAGLAELILTGSTPRPPNAKMDKTARSTVRNVNWTAAADAAALLRERRANGALVLALEVTDDSTSILDFSFPGGRAGAGEVILVAGSEVAGVPAELLAECQAAVHLPMFGRNTSLNVVVACGVGVYGLLARMLP